MIVLINESDDGDFSGIFLSVYTTQKLFKLIML